MGRDLPASPLSLQAQFACEDTKSHTMTSEQYLRALKKLGLTVASNRIPGVLGFTIRQSIRYARGDNEIPAPIVKLLACLIAAQSRPSRR